MRGGKALKVTDSVPRIQQPRDTFLFDVSISCPVRASSEWSPDTAYDAHGLNPFLQH